MRFNARQEEAAGVAHAGVALARHMGLPSEPRAHRGRHPCGGEGVVGPLRAALTITEPERRRLVICNVTQVIHEFIGCAGDQQTPPRWINLRNVQEITPAPER